MNLYSLKISILASLVCIIALYILYAVVSGLSWILGFVITLPVSVTIFLLLTVIFFIAETNYKFKGASQSKREILHG
jgi:hypothetical protein